MSLWTCPEHGLYGGDVFCPECGGTGAHTTLTGSYGRQTDLPPSVIEAAIRIIRGNDIDQLKVRRLRDLFQQNNRAMQAADPDWVEMRQKLERCQARNRAYLKARLAQGPKRRAARTANETGKVER